MIRLSRFTLLFLVFIFVAPLALASQTAVKLASGIDLIKEWQADQHLYISGDINLSSQELANLEDWLDQNGKNWTVLLSQSSAKERHRDPFGAQRRGVEALEIALTVDLPAKTGFGKIIDQKTGHPNGALFIIHLKERQLSYYGSDYYQHNGAPTHRFQNDLDAPARKALRDGGRIVDAVKRTVTAVDSRARTTINSRAQRRLESAQAAKQEIIDLRQKLKSVTAKHAAISAKLTKSGGDLSHFPAAKFENQLSNMEKKPTIFNSSLIRDELTKWDKHLKVYHTDAERFTKLTEQLEGAQPTSEKGKANQKASLAQLAKARENYQLGNFSYQEQLRHGENLFSSIEPADALALQKEQRRRDTLKIGGATTAGGLCLIGFLGNRRRRRIKAEAEALLAARKLEIKETEDRLFELMDRAAIIVGPFNELKSRGYQGETLTLSKKALKEIDRAFVLSSNVQKIIEEGEELISPSNPLSRSTNIVTGGRYEKAVDLLDAELNLGLQNVPELKERSRPGEEVDGTFSVPIDEWGARTTQALDSASECLDRVEDAWSTIVARRETLNTNIEALVSRQNEIQVDEWLRCELLFDEWIPAMTEAETKAAETGKSDPVQALEGDMAEGDRMAQEAKTQLDLLTKFRSQHWQDLEKNEATLDDRKRATIWVDERLAQLSKSADDIASTSPDGTVADSISNFGDDLQAFSQRVSHSASLIVRADDEALPSIKNTTQVVTIARQEIANALSLSPEAILQEEDRNPSDFLTKASQQHEAALAALDLGEANSADGFLNEVDRLTAHSADLVARARKVLIDYPDASEVLWKRRGELEERGLQLTRETETMRQRYAPRALFLDPNSPELGTLADSPGQLDSDLKSIVTRLDHAKTRYHAGGILETWDLILDGQAYAQEGEALCKEVTTRFQKLAQMEKDNSAKHQSQSRASADFQEPIKDRRVTQNTVKLHELIKGKLNEAAREIEAGDGRRDPYLVDTLLAELDERLPILRKAIEEDLEQHKRALQLFDTVQRNQQEAKVLWETAENDHIPNSQKTNAALDEIESNHAKLNEVHQQLQIDHSDWRELQNDLRAIHLSLSEAVIDLKRELQLARQTVNALEAATREVRRAARWSGSYGVRITGGFGGRSLASANEVMQQGRYPEALQLAGRARSAARSAIAQAEAREAAKRRAAAAARRRSQQRATSRSNFGSSSRSRSSFGSSSRSRSSFGSRSGRSSFSSSSRAGRSSW